MTSGALRHAGLVASVLSVWACAPARNVAPEQRARIVNGRCTSGGVSQGLVVVEVGGMARGIPLGGIVVEHLETGRRFALSAGRVLALLPQGSYAIRKWFASDTSTQTRYEALARAEPFKVVASDANRWGRVRLVDVAGRGIALAYSDKALEVRRDASQITVRWSEGDVETLNVGRCVGTQRGTVHTDTAYVSGLTLTVGGGASLLSGSLRSHGEALRLNEQADAGGLTDIGGTFRLGVGWSFGSDGFPLHVLTAHVGWAGYGLSDSGRQRLLEVIDGAGSGFLIGLHGVVSYELRALEDWIVSPVFGLGTGVSVANVGGIEPESSEPDLAWSAELSVGFDARITEDLAFRAHYVLVAPLVGADLPLTHQFVIGFSVLADGELVW